jgi:hypothetical protein
VKPISILRRPSETESANAVLTVFIVGSVSFVFD